MHPLRAGMVNNQQCCASTEKVAGIVCAVSAIASASFEVGSWSMSHLHCWLSGLCGFLLLQVCVLVSFIRMGPLQ